MVSVSTDSFFEQRWRAIAYLFGTYLMLQKNKMKIMMRGGRIVGNGLLLQVISSVEHFKKLLQKNMTSLFKEQKDYQFNYTVKKGQICKYNF